MQVSSTFTLEDRLILACARVDPDAERIAALVGQAPDWEVFLRKTERWGLVPLVDASMKQSGVPTAVAERLRHLRHRETIHGLARFELLRTMLTRFADAAIPVIVLKGSALA